MPLRAISENDNQEFIAPFLNDEQWDSLKRMVRTGEIRLLMPCCDSEARLRVSKLGTKHFFHKSKIAECDWKSESKEHIAAKAEIAIACRDAGYEVSTEYKCNDWRADVFACKGNVKVAFEIQWSYQSIEETESRQSRYKRDGVRAAWFFRRIPADYFPVESLPLFRIEMDIENGSSIFYIDVYGSDIAATAECSLHDFVSALLTRKIRFCTHARSRITQTSHVWVFKHRCYKCGRFYHEYDVALAPFASVCGVTTNIKVLWEQVETSFVKELEGFIREQISVNREDVRFVNVAPVSNFELEFRCPTCNAIQGYRSAKSRFTGSKEEFTFLVATMTYQKTLLKSQITIYHPHWCFPENGEFCCDK